MSPFLLGIAVAVGSFFVKEAVTHQMRGHQFRRRLASFVDLVVEGHAEQLPVIDELIDKISDDRKADREVRWAFQWDASPIAADDLFRNSIHIRPEEGRKSFALFDALQRADRIRQMYNESVVVAVSDHGRRDGATRLAATTLRDLRWEYKEVIGRGCELLTEFSKAYPLLEIRARKYEEIFATHCREGE